jgi:hypothetical protein
MESTDNICPTGAEGEGSMATKLTPKKSGGAKPAPKKKVSPNKATPKAAVPDRRPASAKAKSMPKAEKTPPSRKDAPFNAETAQVLRDAEAGKDLLDYPSLEAMFEDLDI